ncbi:MAG: transcription termination/antitermination protein NusA [Chloroflexi bacterium]|nr:transcription termination/antitermination protein NusA [Chloroflexota bacterium]
MKSDFALAFNEILETRALPKEVVLEAIQQAMISAYRRDASVSSSQQKIEVTIGADGVPIILVEKEVVEDVVDNQTEVLISEARNHEPECQIGDLVMVPVEYGGANFGRIAAQTAKQVILQRIREAERETLYEEFIEREGDLITGTVQSTSSAGVTLNLLGRAEAIMPRAHQMPNERYRTHDKIRVYVVEVNKSTRGPQIIVSRTHKDMLRRLLEYEVPEIYNGQVEIKSIAREAGYRSKVAVAALQESIDPVGACVGMRGMRIQNIIKELNSDEREKIDVIEWDSDPAKFIAKALSPARVSGVYLDEELDQMRTATVVVPEDHLSLAIGREGQNARLAAKLTGWRIDIKSVTETAVEDFEALDTNPALSHIRGQHAQLVEEVERVLEKRKNNRPIMPEEYTSLIRFVDQAESAKVNQRSQLRKQRVAMLESVRPLVPDAAFDMPIETLELADDIVRALGRIDNVGELMVRVLSDEQYLADLLAANRADDDALEAIKYALDDLVLPEIMAAEEGSEDEDDGDVLDEAAAEAEVDEGAEPEVVAEGVPEEPGAPEESVPEVVASTEEVEMESAALLVSDEEAPPAFPEPELELEPEPDVVEKAQPRKPAKEEVSEDWYEDEDLEEEFDDDELLEDRTGKRGKKSKKRRVQLIYDEDLGEVIAKRRRKGSRRRNDFDEFDFSE